MGKSWDSTHELSKYLWLNSTFVNSAIKLLNVHLLEPSGEGEKVAHPNVNMHLSDSARDQIVNALSALQNLPSSNAQRKDFADLLVLTKPEVWDLLKELSPSHTKIAEGFLSGVKENALFVMPISLLRTELMSIAHKNVLPSLKVADIEAKEILLTSMDQTVLRNAIEAMIGTNYVEKFMQETNGNVSIVSSTAKEKKFNVITLSHIKREDLMIWITSLLSVINAMQESKTIHNYLIENFYKQTFKEVLRVCKPGAMIAIFGGTRTFHRLTSSIEDAGFEIRDVCMYMFGSGFPKSHNFGRKMEGDWQKYGTALKPAYEPIILAMKPLDGNFKQNAEKWGVGGINIDEARIPIDRSCGREKYANTVQNTSGIDFQGNKQQTQSTPLYDFEKGRWPANLILDEEAAELLDQQSGVLKSGFSKLGLTKKENQFFKGKKNKVCSNFNDSGGASRFFYTAKASSAERNRGLEGFPDKPSYMVENGSKTSGLNGERYEKTTTLKNNHPTVKPLSLMKYLLKLLAPPGDPIVLDPFCGSGSTLVAAKELGIRAIGIEKSEEYCEIARARVAFEEKERFMQYEFAL